MTAQVAPRLERASAPAQHPCPRLQAPARRRVQGLCPDQAAEPAGVCPQAALPKPRAHPACPCPFPVAVPAACGLTGSCSARRSRRCAGWAQGRTRRSPAQLLQAEAPAVRGPAAWAALTAPCVGTLLVLRPWASASGWRAQDTRTPGSSLSGSGVLHSQRPWAAVSWGNSSPSSLQPPQPCTSPSQVQTPVLCQPPRLDVVALPLISGTTPYSVQSVDKTMAAKWAPAECPHR